MARSQQRNAPGVKARTGRLAEELNQNRNHGNSVTPSSNSEAKPKPQLPSRPDAIKDNPQQWPLGDENTAGKDPAW